MTPEVYRWNPAGKPVSVALDLDVVDRLLREVQRGFGMVPRKGVEMGGILLGAIEPDPARPGHWTVRVDDFEPVSCQHARGVAYLLSDEEQTHLEDTLARWSRTENKQTYVVGLYRGHTREGLGLTQEDVDLFNRYFPDPSAVMLLVKPFATRTSVGSFFFRENGAIRTQAGYLEFPFKRTDLAGEPAPAQSTPPTAGRHPISTGPASAAQAAPAMSSPTFGMSSTPEPPAGQTAPAEPQKKNPRWVWIPLSFVFLLLGIVLGFQIALSVQAQIPGFGRNDPYSLGLAVAPSDDGLEVRWDRSAPAIAASSRGALTIIDGGNQRVVNLDAAQLQNGSVIYRNPGNDVALRLEVFARDRVAVSETLAYRTGTPRRAN